MQVIAPMTDNSFASTFAKLVREERPSEALEPKKIKFTFQLILRLL